LNHNFQQTPPEDLWLNNELLNIENFISRGNGLMLQEEQDLVNKVKIGEAAEIALVTFRDFLLTSNNPSDPLPIDATSRERNIVHEELPFPHPCSIMHCRNNNEYAIGGDNANEIYTSLTNFVQRHRHHNGYCMKEGKCRFNFPRPLLLQTRCIVKQIAYKMGTMKDKLRRVMTELQFQTNDRWMNSHSPLAMLTWGANMDMSILIDAESVISYVAKYCSKTETASGALSSILQTTIKNRIDNGETFDTKKILRSVFNKVIGQRDKCIMETNHLLNSTPIAICSHDFMTINIASSQRKINNNVPLEDYSESALIDNIIDMYSKRMSTSYWPNNNIYGGLDRTIMQNMPLYQFVRTFKKMRGKNIILKREINKKIIFIFSPQINSDPNKDSTYFQYCYYSLLKYKPWQNFYENVLSLQQYECSNLDQLNLEMQQHIITEWTSWLNIQARMEPNN
jgi:hypothetical protein